MNTKTPRAARSSLPRVYRRLFWPWLIVPLAIHLVVLGATWWMNWLSKPGPYLMGLALMLPVAVGLGASLVGLRQRSLRTLVGRTRGLVCTECGFDLSGSTGQTQCPECGVEYDPPRLIEAWKACRFLPPE